MTVTVTSTSRSAGRLRFKLYDEVHVERAEDFLDLFMPHRGGPLWDRRDNAHWVFRGQAEAAWDLTPSALRHGDPWHKFRPGQINEIPITGVSERINSEEWEVVEFASRAATLGYEIPWDSVEIRDKDNAIADHDGNNFPPPRMRGLYALAQHYRVPTRLLDWSEKPLTSAYFAAIGSVGRHLEDGSPDRFAVWALAREFVESFCRERNPGAVIVTVPQTSNPNLRAQAGLFTLVRFLSGEKRLPPSLDLLFRDEELADIAWAHEGVPNLPMLFKFTCPHSEARFLLHYLYLAGVDASSVYHGHASIVEARQETGLRSVCTREQREAARRSR